MDWKSWLKLVLKGFHCLSEKRGRHRLLEEPSAPRALSVIGVGERRNPEQAHRCHKARKD